MNALLHLRADVLVSTAVAGAVVIAFGLLAARHASAGVPGCAQLAWETLIGAVERRLGEGIGSTGRKVVPLAVTLFAFILVATWLEVIPSGHPDKASRSALRSSQGWRGNGELRLPHRRFSGG